MTKLLIKNGTVWDGEKFFYADVLTENKIISKIQKKIDDKADYVYDALGKIVSPGLIDIHTHFKGLSNNNIGISASMSSIPFGVISAADASATLGDTSIFNHFDTKTFVFVCAEFKNNKLYFENTKKLIKTYGSKVVGIKVYFDQFMSDISDISPLKQTVEFAERNNLIVMVHSTNSPSRTSEILSILRCGDILTHTYHGGQNNIEEDGYKCLLDAKKRGIIIDAGFAGHIHTNFDFLKKAVISGAYPDVISTDITKLSAYKRGGKYGMTEENIFRAVTSTAARAIGIENEAGYLKEGKCADIAVFEYDNEGFSLCDKQGNLLESKQGYRCLLTVVNGEILYRY